MRTIIKEAVFEQQATMLIGSARRADEFLRGAEWLLARDPRSCGRRVAPESSVWRMVHDEGADMTPIALYYTFDADTVYLLEVETPDESQD